MVQLQLAFQHMYPINMDLETTVCTGLNLLLYLKLSCHKNARKKRGGSNQIASEIFHSSKRHRLLSEVSSAHGAMQLLKPQSALPCSGEQYLPISKHSVCTHAWQMPGMLISLLGFEQKQSQNCMTGISQALTKAAWHRIIIKTSISRRRESCLAYGEICDKALWHLN